MTTQTQYISLVEKFIARGLMAHAAPATKPPPRDRKSPISRIIDHSKITDEMRETKAEFTVPPGVMAICVEETERHGVPLGAVMSARRFPLLTCVRHNIWRRCCKELGLSQSKLAKVWGVRPSAISHGLKCL